MDFESQDYLPEEKETYQVGEEINEKIKDFLVGGMKKGDLRDDIKIMPTIFQFWGMLSGLIQLAANKEEYIEKTIHLSKIQFLEYGFDMLYRSIEKEGVKFTQKAGNFLYIIFLRADFRVYTVTAPYAE